MPRVLVRPRIPRRSLPRSTVGLPRDFGIPGRGSDGCSSIATYVVFATGAFFFFDLLDGAFFLPFFTNFLIFPFLVPLAKPSPVESDSSAESGLLTGSAVPTCSAGGNGFMDPLAFDANLSPVDHSVAPGNGITKKVTYDYTQGLINELSPSVKRYAIL